MPLHSEVNVGGSERDQLRMADVLHSAHLTPFFDDLPAEQKLFPEIPFKNSELRALFRQLRHLRKTHTDLISPPVSARDHLAALPGRFSSMAKINHYLPGHARLALIRHFNQLKTEPHAILELISAIKEEILQIGQTGSLPQRDELQIFLDGIHFLSRFHAEGEKLETSLFPLNLLFNDWKASFFNIPNGKPPAFPQGSIMGEFLVFSLALALRDKEKYGLRVATTLLKILKETANPDVPDIDFYIREYMNLCAANDGVVYDYSEPSRMWLPKKAQADQADHLAPTSLATPHLVEAEAKGVSDAYLLAKQILGDRMISILDRLFYIKKTKDAAWVDTIFSRITPEGFYKNHLGNGYGFATFMEWVESQSRNAPMSPLVFRMYLSYLSLNLNRLKRGIVEFLYQFNGEAESPDFACDLGRLTTTDRLAVSDVLTSETELDKVSLGDYLMAFYSVDPESSVAKPWIENLKKISPFNVPTIRSSIRSEKSTPLLALGTENVLMDILDGKRDWVDIIFHDVLRIVLAQQDSPNCTLHETIQNLEPSKMAFERFNRNKEISVSREHAILEIGREYGDELEAIFKENPGLRFVYNDAQFKETYKSTQIPANSNFLSTNFDLAQIGLTDTTCPKKALEYMASRNLKPIAEMHEGETPDTSDEFVSCWDYCTRKFLSASGFAWAFKKENFHLTESGTEAFELLSRSMGPNDTLLVTSEEYEPLYTTEDFEAKKMKIERLGQLGTRSPEEFQAEIESKIKACQSKRVFMLVSDVTRRGTLHPLEAFQKARDAMRKQRKDQEVYLIVDGCQSFCRVRPNLPKGSVDAYFLSTFKAADIGRGGALMLSEAFARQCGTIKPKDGGKDITRLVQMTASVEPTAVGFQDGELSYNDRILRINILSAQFARIVQMINRRHKGRIEILFPKNSLDLEGNPIPEQMTGIFECRIKGCARADVSECAKQYGIHIAAKYDDPTSPDTFRVSFHPRMGPDALKLLAYVLEHCKPGQK